MLACIIFLACRGDGKKLRQPYAQYIWVIHFQKRYTCLLLKVHACMQYFSSLQGDTCPKTVGKKLRQLYAQYIRTRSVSNSVEIFPSVAVL